MQTAADDWRAQGASQCPVMRRVGAWVRRHRQRWLDAPAGCCLCGTGGPYVRGSKPQVTRYLYVGACGEPTDRPDWSSCSQHPLTELAPIVDYGTDVVRTNRETEADTAAALASRACGDRVDDPEAGADRRGIPTRAEVEGEDAPAPAGTVRITTGQDGVHRGSDGRAYTAVFGPTGGLAFYPVTDPDPGAGDEVRELQDKALAAVAEVRAAAQAVGEAIHQSEISTLEFEARCRRRGAAYLAAVRAIRGLAGQAGQAPEGGAR
jgi:hypothetical protein